MGKNSAKLLVHKGYILSTSPAGVPKVYILGSGLYFKGICRFLGVEYLLGTGRTVSGDWEGSVFSVRMGGWRGRI